MTHRRILAAVSAAALGVSLLPAIANAAPTATPTTSATPSQTPSAAPSETPAATPSETPSATPSATPADDATPDAAATPGASATPASEEFALQWGGASCDEPFQTNVEGNSATVSYCYRAEDGSWKPLTKDVAAAHSDVPGASVEMAIYEGESKNIADLVKPGSEVDTKTLNADGTLTIEIPEGKYVAVAAAGVPLNGSPAFIYGSEAPEINDPSATPTPEVPEINDPSATPTPEAPEIDPTKVAALGDGSACEMAEDKTFTPGDTYTFTACNAFGEKLPGAEIKIYTTADGNLGNLTNGSLVDTVMTDENGQFTLTVPESGYIGVVATNSLVDAEGRDVRFIIGADPHSGEADMDNGKGKDKGDSGKGGSGKGKGKGGLPKTGL